MIQNIVLCMVFLTHVALDASDTVVQTNDFSYGQDYQALYADIENYLQQSNKTKNRDNQIIELIDQFQENLKNGSEIYRQNIVSDDSVDNSVKDRVSEILRNMSSGYIALQNDITKLRDSTGFGWRTPDEEQRGIALNGLKTMIERLYDRYNALRNLVLTQSKQAHALQVVADSMSKIEVCATQVKSYVDQIKEQLGNIKKSVNDFEKVYTKTQDKYSFHNSFTRLESDVLSKANRFLQQIDQLTAQSIMLYERIQKLKGISDDYTELYAELDAHVTQAQEIQQKVQELVTDCTLGGQEIMSSITKFLTPEYQAKYLTSQTTATKAKQTPSVTFKTKGKGASIVPLNQYDDIYLRLSRLSDNYFSAQDGFWTERQVRQQLSTLDSKALEELTTTAISQTVTRLAIEQLEQNGLAGGGAAAGPVNKLSKNQGKLVTVYSAQKAFAAGNQYEFSQIINNNYERFLDLYSQYISSAWASVGVAKATEPSAMAMYVPRLLNLGNSLVRDLDIPAATMAQLSSSDQKKVATEVLTHDKGLGLVSLQIGLVSERFPSDESLNNLSLFSTAATKASGTPNLSDIFMRLKRSDRQLMDMISVSAPEITADVHRAFLDGHRYRPLFYPVTGASLVSLEFNNPKTGSLQAAGSGAASSAVSNMQILPAAASDSLVTNAVEILKLAQLNPEQKLARRKKIRTLKEKVVEFGAAIEQSSYFKTGELNEVVIFANLDLGHRLFILLLTSIAEDIFIALDEINKKPSDMLDPKFDRELELYERVKPDAYYTLKNRQNLIEVLFHIAMAGFRLLQKIADNFDILQPESQQLALEAVIAAQPERIFLTSRNLLGGIAPVSSSALTTLASAAKTDLALVVRSLGLPPETAQALSSSNQLETLTGLALVDTTLRNTALRLEREVRSDSSNQHSAQQATEHRQALDALQTERVNVLQQVQNLVARDTSLQQNPRVASQIKDNIHFQIQNITAKRMDQPQESEPLTKEFMDYVATKAQEWFNKLPNKTGMIRFKDVEKVVQAENFDENKIYYVNGTLQAMALYNGVTRIHS